MSKWIKVTDVDHVCSMCGQENCKYYWARPSNPCHAFYCNRCHPEMPEEGAMMDKLRAHYAKEIADEATEEIRELDYVLADIRKAAESGKYETEWKTKSQPQANSLIARLQELGYKAHYNLKRSDRHTVVVNWEFAS